MTTLYIILSYLLTKKQRKTDFKHLEKRVIYTDNRFYSGNQLDEYNYYLKFQKLTEQQF